MTDLHPSVFTNDDTASISIVTQSLQYQIAGQQTLLNQLKLSENKYIASVKPGVSASVSAVIATPNCWSMNMSELSQAKSIDLMAVFNALTNGKLK